MKLRGLFTVEFGAGQESGTCMGNPAGSLRCVSGCHGFGSRRRAEQSLVTKLPDSSDTCGTPQEASNWKGSLGAPAQKKPNGVINSS